MYHSSIFQNRHRNCGFSLIEVVLAIGIFLVTVLALVGLLGPTLQSVEEVEKTDEVASVVNTLNAFLQNSPEIVGTATTSRFDLIYQAVEGENYATVFVFNEYIDNTANDRLAVGFLDGEVLSGGTLGAGAEIPVGRFEDASGTIYRAVLTPSSVIPEAYRSADRNTTTETYQLNTTLANYLEGYFAMEVRIYAEDPPAPGTVFTASKTLTELSNEEPLFTYNTAVVR